MDYPGPTPHPQKNPKRCLVVVYWAGIIPNFPHNSPPPRSFPLPTNTRGRAHVLSPTKPERRGGALGVAASKGELNPLNSSSRSTSLTSAPFLATHRRTGEASSVGQHEEASAGTPPPRPQQRGGVQASRELAMASSKSSTSGIVGKRWNRISGGSGNRASCCVGGGLHHLPCVPRFNCGD